jgi:hypothetical protein
MAYLLGGVVLELRGAQDGGMKQVIYRRSWCPRCREQTLVTDRSEYDDEDHRVGQVVTCTQCLLEVPT